MKWNFDKIGKSLAAAVIGITAILTPAISSTVLAQGTAAVSNWTREVASQIKLNDSNTAPIINKEDLEKMSPDYLVWDTWPLQDRQGHPAVVNGYKIIFALTVPRDVIPGKRHDTAEIRYFYSKDGKGWELGGLVFNDGKALGSRQWAGSAFIDKDGKIHMFYTATGRKNETRLTYEQRIATTTGDIVTTNTTVTFKNWSDHKIILEPDGKYYQTQEQSNLGDLSYSFRDPYFFEDPKSGEQYILFEANTSGTAAERTCQPEQIGSIEFRQTHDTPEKAKLYNGSIGIAKASNGNLTEFKELPPLLEANCVNEELERPNVIVKGNNYYLFTKTHTGKFAPGLKGPEGLYGFTSSSLFGSYKPLNGSGLVIGNPGDNPYQGYSWLVMPNGTVISYVEYVDVEGKSIDEIGQESPEYQKEHFGGMLAPSLKISITQDRTDIVTEKKQGVFK